MPGLRVRREVSREGRRWTDEDPSTEEYCVPVANVELQTVIRRVEGCLGVVVAVVVIVVFVSTVHSLVFDRHSPV